MRGPLSAKQRGGTAEEQRATARVAPTEEATIIWSVLISIRPEWCDKITSLQKTVELRKTRPKILPPFLCYIYETKTKAGNGRFGTGAVIGKFICDGVARIVFEEYEDYLDTKEPGFYQWWDCADDWALKICAESGLSHEQWRQYFGNKGGWAWHISELTLYDAPKALSEFGKSRPPQSWCYLDEPAGDS